MGGITLRCTASTGSRLMGIAYAAALDSQLHTGLSYTHVLLVQSNSNPTSVSNTSWSLINAWQQNTEFFDTYIPEQCHIDSATNIFTLIMSNYGAKSTTVGFLYDPGVGIWTNIVTSASYQWYNLGTFTMFTYPNTTFLYQLSVAPSNNTTVNYGIIGRVDSNSYTFTYGGSWELNPSVYGYPTSINVGKDAFYQFGFIPPSNSTASPKPMLTRVPFNETYGNISTYAISDYSDCISTQTVSRFYKDTLYVICEISRMGIVSGGEDSILWGYDYFNTQEGISLDSRSFGNITTITSAVNITDPYGNLNYMYFDGPEEHSKVGLILGITLPLLFVLVMSILAWRYRESLLRFRRQIWPRWKRRVKAKIIEIASKIDDGETDNNDTDINLKNRSKNVLSDDNSTINKIEEIPMSKIDMDECHKILVTPDMDLSDLDMTEATATTTPAVIDAETGYMQNANLEYHPRPSIITSMSAQSNLNSERITETLASSERSDNSQSPISQHFVTSEATLSVPSTSRNAESSQRQGQQPVASGLKAISIYDEDAEEYVPPYSHPTDVSIPRGPPLLVTATPSAPPLYADDSDSDPSSSSMGHDTVIDQFS
ncbi:hypothetical protein BGZ46_008869 [Entomortierella lignicola]|nr:hypothetical protein BGZ46_008869 [Entomortierella lignicola]